MGAGCAVMFKRIGSAVVVAGILSLAVFSDATPAKAREVVSYSGPAGAIVVKTGERRLYYGTGDGRAVVYPVGVGRKGKQWAGESYIAGKYLKPAWSPPEEVRHDKPSLPGVIPGGVP